MILAQQAQCDKIHAWDYIPRDVQMKVEHDVVKRANMTGEAEGE